MAEIDPAALKDWSERNIRFNELQAFAVPMAQPTTPGSPPHKVTFTALQSIAQDALADEYDRPAIERRLAEERARLEATHGEISAREKWAIDLIVAVLNDRERPTPAPITNTA